MLLVWGIARPQAESATLIQPESAPSPAPSSLESLEIAPDKTTTSPAINQDEFELIDQIEAIVYGAEDIKVFAMSDAQRMGLDGKQRTIKDLVNEELWFQLTLKYKIPVEGDEMVDHYLASLQKEYHMTLDDIKQIFKASGYTYEEGRKAIKRMQVVHGMKDQFVRSKVVVTQTEINEYYTNNPEYKSAKYKVQVAFIPYQADREAHYNTLLATLSHEAKNLNWSSPTWLKDHEIAEDKSFIKRMKPKQLSKPQKSDKGYLVYRLVESKPERLVPLKKRYPSIVNTLRGPKFGKVLQEYENNLIADAVIIYPNALAEEPA